MKSIHAIGAVIDEINENQSLIARTVSAQRGAAQNVSQITDETRQRSHVIAASIEQLSLVAEATETDAAGTDREARRLLDLAKQIGDLTSRIHLLGDLELACVEFPARGFRLPCRNTM